MSCIQAVFVDAGGVFLLPDPGPVLAAFARAGAPVEREELARGHYAGIRAWDEHPRLDARTWRSYLTHFAREVGVPAQRLDETVEILDDAWRGVLWSQVIDASARALHEITARDVEVAVVSNSDGTVERLLREGAVCQVGAGDGACVKAVIDSSVVGVSKPDPRIFEIAMDAVGVAPEHAIHVGDSVLTDIAGARRAGIRPLHLDPFGFCAFPDHEHVGSLFDVVRLLEE